MTSEGTVGAPTGFTSNTFFIFIFTCGHLGRRSGLQTVHALKVRIHQQEQNSHLEVIQKE
jgi:hypothetical protein